MFHRRSTAEEPTADPRPRAPYAVLLAIVATFTAIEAIVLLKFSGLGDLAVESDFLAEIAPAARHLAAGQLHVADYPFKGPMSAVVLAIGNVLLGPLGLDAFRVGTLISLLAAVGSLGFVYRIGLALWGRRAALGAVVLTAAQSVFFVNAHKAGSDQLFLLFVLAAVHLGLQPSRGWRRLLGLGALGGLAFLTRYIGVVMPVWLAVAVAFGPAGARRPARECLAAVGVVLAGALLVALPWFAVNLAETGAPLTQQNLQNTVQAFYPAGAPAGAATSLTALIAAAPGRFAARYLANLVGIARGDFTQVLGAALAVAALAGLALALADRRDRRPRLVVALAAFYVGAYGFVFYTARFSLPLVPVYALLAASLLERRAPRWLPIAVVALLVVALAQQARLSSAAVRFYHGQDPVYLRPSIAYLREQAAHWTGARAPRVMARRPHAAWYGRMDYVPYPAKLAGAAELLERARAAGVDFLCAGIVERTSYLDAGFVDRLDTYEGVRRVFAAGGNTIYRLEPDAAIAGSGERSGEVARAQANWQAALAASDTARICTEGTQLIQALDHDGRVREALAVAMRLLDVASRGDEPLVRLYAAQACLKLGETSRGLAVLEPHLSVFDATGRPQELAWAQVVIARLYEDRGERTVALGWARRAQALYRQAALASEASELDALVGRLARPAR